MITFPLLGKAGRLGNQLWEIASTIGIARTHGEEVSFPDWVYRPYFNLPDEFFRGASGTDASTLVPHLDTRCAVYLQDYSLWSDIEDEVREYLRPSQFAYDYVLKTYPWFLQLLDNPVVGVHVRRGDNVIDPGTPDKYLYHPLRSEEYYCSAVQRYPEDMAIVVFSDDLSWCKENMPRIFGRPCYVFAGGTPRLKEHEIGYDTAPVTDWVDLVAMAMTYEQVLSNSTFSWWAAFLSGSVSPVYPSNWFGKNLDYIDTSLMFPLGWTQVHDSTVRPSC